MTDSTKIRKRKPRREPNRGDVTTSRLVTTKQFEQYMNIGRTRAMEYARSINAVVSIGNGRLNRIDLNIVDADLNARYEERLRAAGGEETA